MPAGRPRGSKSAASIKLIETMYDIAQERHPISVRGICYPLLQNHQLILDMSTKQTKKVGRLLTMARKDGVIPWEWIVEEGRQLRGYYGWNNSEEFIEEQLQLYRQERWNTQPNKIQIWSEKATLGGVLQPVLDEFALPFLNVKGFGSTTSMYNAAKSWAAEPFIVLYLGDHDPSGLWMSEEDIPARFTEYLQAVLKEYKVNISLSGEPILDLQRIALTPEDTQGLISLPIKNQDPRAPWFKDKHGHQCFEVDGLNPNTLRDKLRAAVMEYIDVPAWNLAGATEKAERESMSTFLDTWNEAKAKAKAKAKARNEHQQGATGQDLIWLHKAMERSVFTPQRPTDE